jgi:serine/threonine protein kinase
MSTFLHNTLIGGKYRVGPILGAGSFGEIYLATDESNGQILALKKVYLFVMSQLGR